MRPILWGTIWFVIGGIGWIGFSILAGILEYGKSAGFLTSLYRFFGIIFFFSLPVAIICEVIRWIRKRKKGKELANNLK